VIHLFHRLVIVAGFVLVAAACGGDDATVDTAADDRPAVVVTTNILGDVVEELVDDQAEVVVIMPIGADPHDFQASAREVDQINQADALITNGAGFEEGLLDAVEAAEEDGVPGFEAISAVATIEFGAGEDHDEDHADEDHADEDHEDDDHADDDDHDHAAGGSDPHFFTDPNRMAEAAEAITGFLIANVDGIDADALRLSADDYIAELEALDTEVAELLSGIDDHDRILVTNHEVFGYFADRYGFEVVGTVIPGGSTADGADARALSELAATIEAEGVPAIFADTSSSNDLAQTLAAEAGDIAVVELFSESLSDEPDGNTYIAMVRTNAERIAAALGT